MPSNFYATSIQGVFELQCQPVVDTRGAFLNAFRAHEDSFMASWGNRGIAQVNLSRSESVGTVRGLHMQDATSSEAKLVRCLKGRVWDVAVDLRPSSSTFCQWKALELSAERSNAFLIPEGCAHGFQVLEPGSELLYLHSQAWVPQAELGVRWDDPKLAIPWPLAAHQLSKRDLNLPFLSDIIPFL